jgi:rhodanese-related sulfurtransferase
MQTLSRYGYLVTAWLMLFIFSQCSHVEAVQTVNSTEAEKMIQSNINNPEFIILDVRTPGEFESGHIGGAINIDYNADDFETKISQIDKTKIYLVYCRTGHRSSKAVSMMKEKGFKSINNLDGGISDWAAQNLPVVTH